MHGWRWQYPRVRWYAVPVDQLAAWNDLDERNRRGTDTWSDRAADARLS
jgi:hypothetical protein